MSALREAAQQALEALEQSETTVRYEGFGLAHREAERKHQAAITALRAALAQQDEPVQEPVPQPGVWMHPWPPVRVPKAKPAQEQAEPVAWLQPKTMDAHLRPDLGYESCSSADYGAFPVYRAPPHCPNCASLEAQNDELDRKLAEMERAEPVAVVGTQVDVWRGCDGRWAPPGAPIKTALMLTDMPVGTMLYTAPPKRQPLSGLEVERLLEQVIGSLPAARNLVRAIERAHGIIESEIKGKNT